MTRRARVAWNEVHRFAALARRHQVRRDRSARALREALERDGQGVLELELAPPKVRPEIAPPRSAPELAPPELERELTDEERLLVELFS